MTDHEYTRYMDSEEQVRAKIAAVAPEDRHAAMMHALGQQHAVMTVLDGATREEALALLEALQEDSPSESSHMAADDILLWLLDDAEVAARYNAIRKWHA